MPCVTSLLAGRSVALLWLGAILGCFLALFDVQGAELVQVTWPTTHASEPPQVPPAATQYLPAFRMAIQVLPEASIVALALSQPALLDLTAEQAGRLQPLTAARYRLMAQSALYAQAASALPYCFAAQKPVSGLASLYVPDGAGPTTPSIVFVHGYGGSFLWYQHYLSEIFPGHILICPAFGVTGAFISPEYVTESIAAASKHLGFTVAKPYLIGLSAGGYGACEVYVAIPNAFSRFICLAANPPENTVHRFPHEARPCFLSGGTEPFVTSGEFQRLTSVIRRDCPGMEVATVSGADHFFLLTHPEPTTACLRRWVLGENGAPRP